MKYTKWGILAATILLLFACEEKAEEKSKPSSNNEVVEVQEERKDTQEPKEVLPVEEPETLYELNEANWTFQPIGDANPKVILLTFDDAPDKYAVMMAQTLKELDVPAIFFVNGHFINSEGEKENVQLIHELGFSIGNHTQTHANLKDLSEEEQKEEIIQVNETVESIIGEKPKFFRAPFGSNTDFSRSLVKSEGMLLMNWTYGYDWEKQYRDSASLTDIMLHTEYLTNGANLLMHDRKWTAEALKSMVNGFREMGYDFIDPLTIKGISSS